MVGGGGGGGGWAGGPGPARERSACLGVVPRGRGAARVVAVTGVIGGSGAAVIMGVVSGGG